MKRFLLPVISILFLMTAFFTSCDVGLGEAVDTEKPTVSIEYPPKNVVIKEDFVINGKCHDETSLKSVTLSFQNSDTKNEYNFTASLSEDRNSWYAEINKFDSENKKYPLPDGTYFVTAVATDGSGKKQEDKSTLRIDNTPPLLVLTNPSTVLDEKTPLESAGGFGATIKLQGSVNDFSVTDNDNGSELVFTVFDKDDKYLGRREMRNIPPSLGIIIGEYTDSTENLTDANNFYNAIYGESGEVVDTKYRKFKITVSDAARTYKGENVAANAEERGNTTEYYYLKDEIYTDVINKFSVGYSEVYEIIKKQIGKTSELSENEKNILAALEQFRHESDDEYEDSSADVSRSAATSRALKIKPVGTFSLNPKNNPSYEITSIDAFDSSASKPWEEKSISTSGNITLLAKCGLSDAPLDSGTFKVILYKTDENGVRLAATDEDKNEDIEIPCEWSKNGANYTGRVTLGTKYVQVAQFYGIELKGQDKTGLEFYNGSKIYRFLVQTGTTPPDVKIEKYSAPSSGSTVYLKKKDSSTEAVDFVIFGTAESRSGSAKGKVTLWPAINKTEYKDNSFTTTSNTENAWSLTIPGKLFNDEKSDTYTVTIYAHDEIANETSKEIFVIFDKEEPKIQINSVNNVVVFDVDTTINADGKTFEATANRGYVNETITVSGNVSDNDAFASGTWKATCDGNDIARGALSSSQIKFEIDTAKGSDGKDLIITLEAYDRAGNKTSCSYNYDDGNPLVISQLTDYPRVNLSNASSDVSDQNDVKIGHNLFDQSGNNRISGSIVDDDGIDSIEIYYSEIGKDDFKLLYNGSLNANGKTSYSINQELKDSDGKALAEGFYKIKIVAKDKKADEKTGTVKTTEITPFVVCINNGAPTITFTNPIKYSDAYQSAEGFMVTGTVTGEFGDSEPITRGDKTISIDENGSWSDFVEKDSSGITQNNDTKVYTITYSVKDRFERATVDSVTFKVDEEAPKTEISQVSPLVTDYAETPAEYKNGAVNGTITVQGSASDNDKVVSTVLKIYKAKIDEPGNPSAYGEAIQSLSYDGTTEKTGDGDAISIPDGIPNTVNNFKFAVDTKKLAENFDNQGIILKIECKDSSGNTGSKEYPVFVCQATDIPTLKFNNGDVNCTNETEIKVGNNLFGMGSNTLYINVTDDDGVKTIKYTVDGKDQAPLLENGTSTTFSVVIDVSNFGDGVHSLRFTVTDVKGKEQSFPPEKDSSIKIAYDNDVPEISVLKLGDVTYSPGCFAKETFTISGKVKDSSGSVTIYEKSDKDNKNIIEIEKCVSEIDWNTPDITNVSGDITKTFVAKDKYGREKTLEINYKVDTEAPKFVSDYIYLTGETVNGSKTYRLGGADVSDKYDPENTWFIGSSFTIKGGNGTNSEIPVKETNKFEIKLYKGSKNSENLISTIQPSGEYKNFSGNIDVGTEPTATIILVAIDEAGNESEGLSISVKVDKDAPNLTEKAIYLENPSGNISATPLPEKGFVNKDEIYVKFEATDSVSKVKTVEIYKTAALKDDEKIGSETFSGEGIKETISDVIKLDVSNFDSKEYDFYIKVTDVAGNAVTSDLPNFIFDKNPPVVTYTSPTANSDVNKFITIEGSIDDLNPPETNSGWNLQLKVKKPNSSFETVTGCTFDTTVETGKFKVSKIDTVEIGDGTVEFIVIATDKAGNTINDSTGKTLTLNINQDSDRPIIQLNTISTSGTTTLSSGTIAGTISDDDGISKLEIQLTKKNGSSYSDIGDSAWETATLNGGNWTYTYEDSTSEVIDGDYKLYFRVTDNGSGVFISGNTDKNKCPKINYEGKNEVSEAVSFSIDTNPPTIKSFEYWTSKDGNTWSVSEKNVNGWNTVNNNELFGGINYRYAKFRVLAFDTVTEQKDLAISVSISNNKKLSTSDGSVKLNNIGDNVDGDYYFETDVVDFNNSNVPTGSYTIEVEAKDKAEKPRTISLGIIVDNTAPSSVTKLNHSSTEELTGEINLSGQVSDDSKANSGIAEMYYAIPYSTIKDEAALADYDKSAEKFGEMWFSVDLTSIVWNVSIKTSYIYTKDGQKINVKDGYLSYKEDETGIYNLPIWFKIVDNAGNVGYVKDNTLRYNPDVDKPRVSITYPIHNVTDSTASFSYVVMGGTIRFTGTAEDDEGIKAVYLQFDMDGDGKYENGENVDGCPAEVVAVEIENSSDEQGNPEKGVLVKGTNSWSYSLKVSDLKNLLYSSDNRKTLNVRAIALDTGTNDSPLLGEWSQAIHISVNNDIPAFESVKIVQYSDDSVSDEEIKTVDYQDDKYISGKNWYLIGKVSSNAGLSELLVTNSFDNSVVGEIGIETPNEENGLTEIKITDSKNLLLEKLEDGGNIKELTYRIPIESTNRWEIKVEVTDNASDGSKKTNYQNYSLNVDNTAPQFYDIRSDSEKDKYGTIKLYKGEYGSSGTILDDKNFIQNSNKIFTLAGRVTEEGSGFENVVFYFKRVPENVTVDNPIRVYNPMESHGLSNNANRTDITANSAENGNVYINSDGLPVLYIDSVSRDENNDYILVSSYVESNKNIRKGGLVKIGGLYRKITDVDYSTGKVAFDSACSSSYKEAEFVYGMVIDNSGESLNYDNSIKNDDGDGMVESFSKSGTNYTWDASIDSTNIPDGPIQIHIVVFDKAGNSNHGYIKTSVSNNAPRIARVRLATDLNSNGKYEENESKVFAYLQEDSKDWSKKTVSTGIDIWNLDGEGWTIKKNLQIEPEFVGGTAPFYYIFTKESGTGEAKNLNEAKTGAASGLITQNKAPFIIENNKFDESSDFEDKINTYQFSFWDSTEETTPCKDSQWTVLNVQLKQDLADTVAPTVVVNPFYWKNNEDNSLYENSLLNGHIELEEDWKNASGYDSSASSGEYDSDPKVSGKIVIKGTAYDDVCLSSLWIKFGKGSGTSAQNFTFNNYLENSNYGINGKIDDYVQSAYYNSSENKWITASAVMENDGWEFAVEDDYFNQDGHKVNWILSIDTSKLSGVAGTDIIFNVMAVDHLNNDAHRSSEVASPDLNPDGTINTSDGVYNRPVYKMDVVPYITGLTTKLSSIEKKNPSVYGRTALGKYPVYYYTKNGNGSKEGESIRFEGFNLSGGSVFVENSMKSIGDLGSDNSFAITESVESGKLFVKVNDIKTLNNINNNDAIGSYAGKYKDKDFSYCYNRQPNGQNNNLLTDDIEIAIWQLNSRAAIPETNRIDAPIMHVNPSNGLIGFAFTHGADLVSYPDGKKNSYINYAKDWTSISQNSLDFVYDAWGNMFGTHSGTDTASNDYKASRYRICSSKWGVTSDWGTTCDYNTAYGHYNALRLEYMGLSPDGTSNNKLIPERITGSKLATTTYTKNGAENTNLYLMYYDSSKDELKFKAGGAVINAIQTTEQKQQHLSGKQSPSYFGDFVDDAFLNKGAYNSEYKNISVVSNNTSSAKASRYFAISAVPSDDGSSDVVVAIWYDPKQKNLWYSYLENPMAKAGNRTTKSSKNGTLDSSWKTPIAILKGDALGDCAIAVDADKHIHIASYTADSGNSVCYTYLDRYDSLYEENKNTVLVDAYDSNGQYLTMDFAKNDEGKTIPYIGYYTGRGYPKYAYLVDTETAGEATYLPKPGADEYNMTTGAWEFVIVPTTSDINVSKTSKISIGVYKDSITGIIKAIPSTIAGIYENAGEKVGYVLGNGTSNAVIAYNINDDGSGYIETAQLK